MRNPYWRAITMPQDYGARFLLAYIEARIRTVRENYDTCQKFNDIIHALASTLHLVSSPWRFYKYGIDIVGPIRQAIGQRKFILVATDYFTKWAEAKAYAHITANHLIQFVQRNIICLFRVPHSFISDNWPTVH